VLHQALDAGEDPKKVTCPAGGPPPEHRGVSLGLWADPADTDDAMIARATTALDEIAALGATDVALVVSWGQQNVKSSKVARTAKTPSDAVVKAVARAARDRNLRVLLFPILTLEELRAGEWRGTLRPGDADAWWSSYEKMILTYARLAAETEAAALSVGSELGSTEAWRDRWFHLISKVEKAFTGDLVYSANWDHYDQPSFWARLDWIGVTGYFELTRDRDASEAALTKAWAPHRKKLEAFAHELGKPLVLTEVGYPAVDGGAVAPWDYTRATDADPEEQRRAFAALAQAWDGSPLAGVFVWEWTGSSYSPRGQPAEQTLRCWFSGRSSPSATSGSPTPPTTTTR
jgi:hypothetical protein